MKTVLYFLLLSLSFPATAETVKKTKKKKAAVTRQTKAPLGGGIELIPKDDPRALKPGEIRIHTGTAVGTTQMLPPSKDSNPEARP